MQIIRASSLQQSVLWDFDKDGGALGSINTKIQIPKNAIVTGVDYKILTTVTGTGGCLPGFKLGINSNKSMFSTFGCGPATLTTANSMFKPSSNSLKYKAIVTSTGVTPTPVVVLQNDFCVPFIGHNLGVGIFSIDTAPNPWPLVVGRTFIQWTNGNAGNVTLRAQFTAGTNIDAYSYAAGVGADNLTDFSFMEIEVFSVPTRISDGTDILLTLVDGSQSAGVPGANDLTAGKVLFTIHYNVAPI